METSNENDAKRERQPNRRRRGGGRGRRCTAKQEAAGRCTRKRKIPYHLPTAPDVGGDLGAAVDKAPESKRRKKSS